MEANKEGDGGWKKGGSDNCTRPVVTVCSWREEEEEAGGGGAERREARTESERERERERERGTADTTKLPHRKIVCGKVETRLLASVGAE